MTRQFEESKKKKKSLIKKILKYTGVTFLLLLVAIIALPFIFKDKLVQIVKDEVNNNLNAKVEFGDFDLSIFSSFPNLSFEIEDVTVDGVGDFEGTRLAKIEKTEITLDVMSVINGDKIEIKKIGITNPTFHIIVNEDSNANYDIVKTSEEISDSISNEPLDYSIGMQELFVRNANLTYQDQISGMSSEIKNLNYNLSGDFTQDVFDTKNKITADELSFSYGGVNYFTKTKLDFDAEVNINEFTKFIMKDNSLKLNELELGFDGWLELAEKSTNIDMNFDSKKTTFKSILSLVPAIYTSDFSTVKTKGKLALNGNVKGSVTETELPEFNVNMNITDGYFKYPYLPNSADNINIKTTISHAQGDLDKMKIDVKKLHLELANNPIDANIVVTTPISDPNIVSEIKADIDLDKLKTVIPAKEKEKLNGLIHADLDLAGRISSITNEEYQNFKAEGVLEIKNMLYATPDLPYEINVNEMAMDFSSQFVDLKSFDSKIGKSDIKASGRIDNILPYLFQDEVLKGNVLITSNKLDVDDLMRSVVESKTEATTTVDSVTSAILVPKYYDMGMNVDVKELIYNGLPIKNVVGGVTMKEQVANLSNVSMDMLDGNITMNGSYNTQNETPKVNFDYKVNNVDIEQTTTFFKSLDIIVPMAKKCKGKISTSLNFVSELDSDMMPVYSSINGKGLLSSNNLMVQGMKVLDKMSEVLKIKELALQKINNLNMQFEFVNGRVLVKPFITKFSGINTTIEGSSGFDQTIDYKINMKVPREKLGSKANEVAEGLLGKLKGKGMKIGDLPVVLPVNFKITGMFTSPKIETDLKLQASSMVTDIKDKVVDTVKKTFNKEIEKIMAEAALQAQKVRDLAKIKTDKLRAEGVSTTNKAKAEADKIANKAKKIADNEATKLSNKGSNMFEKMANKKLAESVKKTTYIEIDKKKNSAYKKAEIATTEANKQADKIDAEADRQAKNIMEVARKKADALKQ